MTRNEDEVKEQYRKHLDPKEFQEFKLNGLNDRRPNNNYDFWFKCLYEYFSTAGFTSDARLLELGSGPTVHNVASASAFISNIVLSEFVEANCVEIRRWLKKEPDHIDWTPFMRKVAEIEGKSDIDAACQEIRARIRSSVKTVVHCDVLDDQVVPPEISKEPYDVVLSCLTLETAATTKESYSAILGRIRKLLKPKGKLVLIGPIDCTYWKVGNNRFHCLQLQPEDIQRALEENNYGDIDFRIKTRSVDENLFDGNKVYFLHCTKY